MRRRHSILGAGGVAFVGVLLGGLLIAAIIPGIERNRHAVDQARRLKQLDTTLSLTLLSARHSPLASFDQIVTAGRALESEAERTLADADSAGRGAGGREGAAIPAARAAAGAAVQRKLQAIEDFKSAFAVLRNATAQLSVLAADLAEIRPQDSRDTDAHARATVLLLALSRELVGGDIAQAHAIQEARVALAGATPGRTDLKQVIVRLRDQSALAERYAAQVSARIGEVVGVPVEARVDDLIAAFIRRNDRVDRQRRVLELGIGLCALASAFLTIRILHVQRRTRVLLEQRVADRTRDLADANERLTRASRAKTEFLANMSHEIRTPLAAILGFTDVLDDEQLEPSERRKIAGILRRNGEHLLGILSNILDIAKIEAGKLTIEEIACSPREIAEEVCSLLRNQAEAKGLRLVLRIEAAAIPRRIVSDPTRIRQILVNLVGNAIKFTNKGSVTLALGIEMRREGPCLKFEVRDSGIGLGPDEVQRVFSAFEQADTSTTRRFGGTGLGLAICQRLSTVLGGEITVTSALERGSTFALLLPLKENAEVTYNLDETAVVAPRGVLPRRGLRVLVADDSTDIQLLLTRFLTDIGALVELAANGRAAVARVLAAQREARPFDIVLMDLHMPELDGAEAVQELRGAGVQQPMIALTASAYLEDRDRCTQAGYSDFLTKPIDRGQLIQRIATLCGEAAAPDPESPQTPESPATPQRPEVPRPEVPDASRTTDFDPGRLLAMVGGDEGAREAVVALFRENAPPLVRAIQDAVATGDTVAVRAAAHKLKGMLLNVCATGPAGLASDLEGAARAGAHERFAPLTASLAIEIRRVCDAMATHDRSAA